MVSGAELGPFSAPLLRGKGGMVDLLPRELFFFPHLKNEGMRL